MPNADDIRKARAERERARRLAEEAGGRGLAGPEGAEFIPLEGSAPSESRDGSRTGRYGESRFVREDQERDDDDNPAFDDQAGATLSFGQPASGARTPRPEVTTVQDVDDDDESGAAGTRRSAHAISQSDRRDRATSSQSLAEHAAFLADASRAAQLPERLDDAARRLGHQLSALQHEHKETARLLQVRIHADDGSPRELFSRALQQAHSPTHFLAPARRILPRSAESWRTGSPQTCNSTRFFSTRRNGPALSSSCCTPPMLTRPVALSPRAAGLC